MSLYWKCQIIGWSFWVVWSAVMSLFFGTLSWLGMLTAVIMSALGLLLSHISRGVIHRGRWKELTPGRLAPRVIAAAGVNGMLLGVATLPLLVTLVARDEPRESSLIQLWVMNSISTSFMFIGWFLVYFCYHFFQRSREAAEAEWRLRVAMRENELRTLRAQLNPHFLFNSLNSLRGLIPESPGRAQEAVTALAGLLRYTLRLSSRPTVSLGEELQAAEHYLELEAVRFEERLDYRIRVPEALLDQAVPPMLLQTLLENAVKHGIGPRREGGTVSVEAVELEGRVRIRVTNPGRVLAASPGLGLGLHNAREQLRLLFPDESELELVQAEPDVVACEVTVPRRTKAAQRPQLSMEAAREPAAVEP